MKPLFNNTIYNSSRLSLSLAMSALLISVSVATADQSICEPSAIKQAIKANPDYCLNVTADLTVPTDEEATFAFQNRINPMSMSNKPSNDIVKLGNCFKGTMAQLHCAADVDFGANGQFQQRLLGFSKTPSGWMATIIQ